MTLAGLEEAFETYAILYPPKETPAGIRSKRAQKAEKPTAEQSDKSEQAPVAKPKTRQGSMLQAYAQRRR